MKENVLLHVGYTPQLVVVYLLGVVLMLKIDNQHDQTRVSDKNVWMERIPNHSEDKFEFEF